MDFYLRNWIDLFAQNLKIILGNVFRDEGSPDRRHIKRPFLAKSARQDGGVIFQCKNLQK
jgi:hypothetical protein